MILLGEEILRSALRRHSEARRWVNAWVVVVLARKWTSITAVRKDYPTADGVAVGMMIVTVFNVSGNKYHLLTVIRYDKQIVQVLDLLTHSEYDKQKWKR